MTTAVKDLDALATHLAAVLRERRAAKGGDGADVGVLTEAEVADILEELGDDVIQASLQELLDEVPEAAAMSPLELSALLAEALAELIEESTS
jgi:hypothetical protein